MIVSLLALLALAPIALSTEVSINEIENSFNIFMEQFSIEQRQSAHNISFESLADLKAESGDDLSVSDSEFIQESDYFVAQKIDKFRPAAYEIFLDAAYNRNNDYYLFDSERSLWRKPDQDFEKVLFNGMTRNQKFLEDKMSMAWEEIIDESGSSLEKKSFWTSFSGLFRGVRLALPRFIARKNVLSNISKNPKFRTAIKGTAAAGFIATVAVLIWKIDDSSVETTGSNNGIIISDPSANKTELIYRLGKKVLTDDVNVYCK